MVAFLTHSFYPVGLFVAHQIHQAWYRLASESFQWCSLSLECFYLRYSCSFTWLLACFFRSLWKYALLGETFPDHFFKMSWIPSYPLCVILFKNLSPLMNSHICTEKCTCHTCTVDVFWQIRRVVNRHQNQDTGYLHNSASSLISLCSLPCLQPPAPGNHWSDFCLCTFVFSVSCKWNWGVYSLCVQLHALNLMLLRFMLSVSVVCSFYCWLVFYYTDASQCFYLPINWWAP